MIRFAGSAEEPREFCRRLDSAVRPPVGVVVAELSFDVGDLSKLRRAVESAATGAGLPPARVDEMVLAVNEIATNAVIHGRSPALLRIWEQEGALVEIRNGEECSVAVHVTAPDHGRVPLRSLGAPA